MRSLLNIKKSHIIKSFSFTIFNFKWRSLSNSVFHNKVSYLYFLRPLISCENLSIFRQKMNLSSVVKVIETVLPKHLAEKWDNTGLLVDLENQEKQQISNICLTNDLTEEVLAEAIEWKTNLILSYHPPIFSPVKAFSSRNWKDRILMKCMANNIAVYSPHTACDAINGGVNDWLIKCFDLKNVEPIKKIDRPSYVLEFLIEKHLHLNDVLGNESDYEVLMNSPAQNKQLVKLLLKSALPEDIIKKLSAKQDVFLLAYQDCKNLNLSPNIGMGRVGQLVEPMALSHCINVVKRHCNLGHVRVVVGARTKFDAAEIRTIACCAGSGASILKGVDADLYITGEMSHHDLLDLQQRNVNVILCEHSNSERGYLKDLADQLRPQLPAVNIIVSSTDRDPVSIF